MKKLSLALLVSIVFALPVSADVLTLTTPQELVSPIAATVYWENVNIDLENRQVIIFYKLRNAANENIPMDNGKTKRRWICRNMEDDPGTTEIDETKTCWTDVFMFSIRAQDEGTPIGRGLRNLLWNQMKNDSSIIDPGNDGTFND